MVLGGAGGLWRDDGYSPCRPTDTLTTHWDGISTMIYIIGLHEVGVFYPSLHPWFDTNVWSFATRKWKEILRKEKSWTWFGVGRLGTGQKNYNLQPFCFSSVLSPLMRISLANNRFILCNNSSACQWQWVSLGIFANGETEETNIRMISPPSFPDFTSPWLWGL